MTITELLLSRQEDTHPSAILDQVCQRLERYNCMCMFRGDERKKVVLISDPQGNPVPAPPSAESATSLLLHSQWRWDTLVSVLQRQFGPDQRVFKKEKKGAVLICVQSHKDVAVAVAGLNSCCIRGNDEKEGGDEGKNVLAFAIDGHSDLIEFGQKWKSHYKPGSRSLKDACYVATHNGLLVAFTHGLVRIDDLALIVFDDCTLANYNHPYCSIMQYFYAAQLAKDMAEAIRGNIAVEDIGEFGVPRILGFATWPRVSQRDDFTVKRARMSKLLQYTRLFQSVIVPIAIDAAGAEQDGLSYLPVEEFEDIREGSLLNQIRVITLDESHETDITKQVYKVIDELLLEAKAASSLIIVPDADKFEIPGRNLLRLSTDNCFTISLLGPQIMIASIHEVAIISMALQQQSSSLTQVIVDNSSCNDNHENSVTLSLTLLAYARDSLIVILRSAGPEGMRSQALEVAAWLTAMAASSAGSSIAGRKIKGLISNWDCISKSGYLIDDNSSNAAAASSSSFIHFRLSNTGALCIPTVSVSMLLAFGSYLPRRPSLMDEDVMAGQSGSDAGNIGIDPLMLLRANCHYGVTLRTMAVKRADSDGNIIDKDRQFFVSRVHLADCLRVWVEAQEQKLKAEETDSSLVHSEEDPLVVTGPLTPSRFSSQTLAALRTIQRLRLWKCLDDNLIPTAEFLQAIEAENEAMLVKAKTDAKTNSAGNASAILIVDDDGQLPSEEHLIITKDAEEDDAEDQELLASAFKVEGPVEETPAPVLFERMWLYVVEYRFAHRQPPSATISMSSNSDALMAHQQQQAEWASHQKVLPDNMPTDTLILSSEGDFMNSDTLPQAYGLLLREPLPDPDLLMPAEIPIGVAFELKARVQSLGQVDLSPDQISTLMSVQSAIFGILNTRPIIMKAEKIPEEEEDLDVAIGGATAKIPPRSIYLVGLLKRQGEQGLSDPFDLGHVEKLYVQFVQMCANLEETCVRITTPQPFSKSPPMWELDWTLMERIGNPAGYPNLLDEITKISRYSEENSARLEAYPAPAFASLKNPLKAPGRIDFSLFALRRLLLYVPYNGIFYRAKRLHSDMNPSSPFETKKFQTEVTTYAEYVAARYGITIKDSQGQPLIGVKRVEGYSHMTKWLSRQSEEASKDARKRGSSTSQRSALIPELVSVFPLPYVMVRPAMILPRLIYDLERQMLIHDWYSTLTGKLSSLWPRVDVMSTSLTGPTAALSYDYERMEVIGDGLLKFWTTIDVYIRNLSCGEGLLSKTRQALICNRNLYRIALEMGLAQHARLSPFNAKLWVGPDLGGLFEEDDDDTWPFQSLLFDRGEMRRKLVRAVNERAEKRQSLHLAFPDGRIVDTGQPIRQYTERLRRAKSGQTEQQKGSVSALQRYGMAIPPKALADLVESVIAAFYLGPGGIEAGRAFMEQVGLLQPDTRSLISSIGPAEIVGYLSLNPASMNAPKLASKSVPTATDSLMNPAPSTTSLQDVKPYLPSESEYPFAVIEGILGHSFSHRRLLFMAMTHSSADPIYCNERLEWLGDAALDWLVTTCLYHNYPDHQWMTPARITEARQAAVSNEAFGRMCVQLALPRYLRIDSAYLQIEIANYSQALLAQMSHESSNNSALLPPAPKTLGDLFEAVAGAVFIDVGFCPDRFKAIYLPLIQWYLDDHADPYRLPDNPISEFWHVFRSSGVQASAINFDYEVPSEEVCESLKFVSNDDDGGIMRRPTSMARYDAATICKVIVHGRSVAQGIGPNRPLARKEAMRAAVKHVRDSGWREFLKA